MRLCLPLWFSKHVHAKLVQHNICNIDSNLIPPWPWELYDKLHLGTLVLVNNTLYCWIIKDNDAKEDKVCCLCILSHLAANKLYQDLPGQHKKHLCPRRIWWVPKIPPIPTLPTKGTSSSSLLCLASLPMHSLPSHLHQKNIDPKSAVFLRLSCQFTRPVAVFTFY